MIKITTNALAVRGTFGRWRAETSGAWKKGLRAAARAVERAAVKRLSGSGAARAYPVPIVTGTLRRGMGVRVENTAALVFNATAYGHAVHVGYHPYGNKRAEKVPARPYLTDAVESVDVIELMAVELRKVLK